MSNKGGSKKTIFQEKLETLGLNPSKNFSRENKKHIPVKNKPKTTGSKPRSPERKSHPSQTDKPKRWYSKQKIDNDYQIRSRRRTKDKPKSAKTTLQKKNALKKTVRLDDFDRYSYIGLTNRSTLNALLLAQEKIASLTGDLTASFRTQAFEVHGKETELVLGFDFGTANTKIVVQEQGSGNAWAIPFANNSQNPYLLPSCVYFDGQSYKLSGKKADKSGNLKLPLIMGNYDSGDLVGITAFIALVIRQSREWFLVNAAESFHQFTFEWFYHLGLPAANNDNKPLVSVYNKVLLAALKLSIEPEKKISNNMLLNCLESINQTATENDPLSYSIGVHPEIQAQLEGYVRSDKWDARKIKFMMVDVGGGTVDASILNITHTKQGDTQFNCLKSKVDLLGTTILHCKRLGWIKDSAARSEIDQSNLIQAVMRAEGNIENINIYPASVEEYVDHSEWPAHFSIDTVLYHEFYELNKRIINEVKNHIDTERAQWNHLQFIFCGGGSLHPIYEKITHWSKLDVISLSKPSKLIAESLAEQEYHRLLVAYGLSFSDQGTFVNASQIEPMKSKQENTEPSWRSNYIDQP